MWQFRGAAGPGIFLDSGQRMGISFTYGAALGDLNGDGTLDAFVVNDYEGNQVWLNNGSGTLIDSGQILSAPPVDRWCWAISTATAILTPS